MTYLIEINDKTDGGKKALNYLQKLQQREPSIRITYKKGAFRKLSAEEMILPGGKKPTNEQLDEFIARRDTGKELTLNEVRRKLEKRYMKGSK